MRIISILAVLWAGLSGAASAATLNETDFAGGFSSDALNPTEISSGFETVTGTIDGTADTFLHFTSLAVGAQQLDFTFNLSDPTPAGLGDFAVGSVEVSQNPLSSDPTNPTEGDASFVLGFFGFFPNSATLSFDLDDTFAGGDLHVSILSTFSTQEFSFGIDVPGNAAIAPAPVPVPAAGLMLLAALGGFAALRRRKPSMLPA